MSAASAAPGGCQFGGSRRDNAEKFVPGIDESFRALILEALRQRVDIDSRRFELRQHGFAISTVRRE
jgi:hypothetical protein